MTTTVTGTLVIDGINVPFTGSIPDVTNGKDGVDGTNGTNGVSPAPADVAAALAAMPSFVAAVAADLAVPVVVVPPPVIITPPSNPALPPVGLLNSKGQPLDVFANGKNFWTGNFNYGNVVETDNVTAPDGTAAVRVTAQTGGNPPGGGGIQPEFGPAKGPGNFDTTGLNFLYYYLWPTRAGQVWLSGFNAAGDVPVGNTIQDLSKYGKVVVGQWCEFRVPVADILPAGTQLLKLTIQDQMSYSNPINAAGNVYYIGRLVWSKS